MGLDADIAFNLLPGVDPLDVGHDLARRVGPDFFPQHPCLTAPEWRAGYDFEIQPNTRYWRPGYERGDWPRLRMLLTCLLTREGVYDLRYGSDCEEYLPLFTAEHLAELDEHALHGEWTYRWSASRFGGDGEPPLDCYGKPMVRYGWGGGPALYRSPASGEEMSR